MNRLRHRDAGRRWIGVALLALLLGQWTVLVHSIAHAGPAAAAELTADADQAWGHGADSPACQLVDHLLAGQAPGGAPAPWACVPPAASRVGVAAPPTGPRLALRAYEARGPPQT